MSNLDIKKITLDALKHRLSSTKFSLRSHLDQLNEVRCELEERYNAYRSYIKFLPEVEGRIKKEEEEISALEKAIKELSC